jgi:hypothetical protein
LLIELRHKLVILFVIFLLSFTGSLYSSSAYQPKTLSDFPVDSSGSWNPNVKCSSPWIVRISDITDNRTGTASFGNSIFSPGLTSPVGSAKRWLTNGGKTPPGWVSPGPGCTIKDSKGEIVAIFVEIDGVKIQSVTNSTDCRTSYDKVNGGTKMGGNFCDFDLPIFDPSVVSSYSTSCKTSTDKTCWYRIWGEIDQDWEGAGYCPSTSTTWSCNAAMLKKTLAAHPSALFDVQGFVYWDPGHVTARWHSFSGWELHPFTAWRLHQ